MHAQMNLFQDERAKFQCSGTQR